MDLKWFNLSQGVCKVSYVLCLCLVELYCVVMMLVVREVEYGNPR